MATASEVLLTTGGDPSPGALLGTANNQGGTTPTTSGAYEITLVEIDPLGIPAEHYKMRGLANPGPGYVVWIVTGAPDFAASQAPSAVYPGTVVLTGTW